MLPIFLTLLLLVAVDCHSHHDDDDDCILDCHNEFSYTPTAVCNNGYIPIGCNCGDFEETYVIDVEARSCTCNSGADASVRCCRVRNAGHGVLSCEWMISGQCKYKEEQITTCSSGTGFYYISPSPQECRNEYSNVPLGVLCCRLDHTDKYELRCTEPDVDKVQNSCPTEYELTDCSCENNGSDSKFLHMVTKCACSIDGGVTNSLDLGTARCCRCQRKSPNRG